MYFIECLDWTVGGQEIWPVLSRGENGELKFKQDFQTRVYWDPVEHKTPRACLETARGMIPNKSLFLSEDESKILIIDNDQACVLYRIVRGA